MTQPEIRFNGFSNEWVEKKLCEMVTYHQPGKYIVESTDYKNEGTPVLTAGKTFILGYTDESIGIYKNSSNGVILFDDFTTSSKFVNFDFKVKSSAIKILTNDDQFTDLKFLFEIISLLEKTPDNHQRQWISSFSKQVVSTPTLPEQQKIGALFSKYDAIIALYEQKLEELNALKKGMLQQIFDDGVATSHKPQATSHKPQVRFNGFNDVWLEKKLGEIGLIQTGSTPSTSELANYSEDGLMWITPTDITSSYVTSSHKRLSKIGEKKSRIADAGSILVTSIASIGKNTIVVERAAFNQQINALTPTSKNNSYFLLAQSKEWSHRMKHVASKGTMDIVNKSTFSNIRVYVPSLPEQQKIGQLFKKLDDRISNEQAKIEQLKAQEQGLLQRML